MTAIQPGPGFVALLNANRHTGDLRAAIDNAARQLLVAIETGFDHEPADPYLTDWFTTRHDVTLLADLNTHGQFACAYEVDTTCAQRIHKLLPTSTAIIASWGESR